MGFEQIFAICVFVGVMALIVSEKVHRAVAALLGAVLLLIFGIIDFDTGIGHVDFNTLGVLCGMMLFVAVIKESGLFEYLAIKSAKMVKGNPWLIMIAFVIITAVLSAFLDNVTTVLLVGPMTFVVCRLLDLSPIPFFMTQILASNVGGTATLIGDPPNIMIGSATGFSFFDFIIIDGPCVIIVLAVFIALFYFIYGRKLKASKERQLSIMELDEKASIRNQSLFVKSIVMIFVVAACFLFHGQLHLESSVIALSAAAIMLLIGGQDFEKMIMGVEWATIGFFAGLFVVVGGLAETGVINLLADFLMNATGGEKILTMVVILWGSAVISAILDNIPFVATMIPVIFAMEATGMDVLPLWWALSLGACLGGNGTLIGASANVVLSGISTREGYPITFMSYLKIGFPMMIVSVIIATGYCLLLFA